MLPILYLYREGKLTGFFLAYVDAFSTARRLAMLRFPSVLEGAPPSSKVDAGFFLLPSNAMMSRWSLSKVFVKRSSCSLVRHALTQLMNFLMFRVCTVPVTVFVWGEVAAKKLFVFTSFAFATAWCDNVPFEFGLTSTQQLNVSISQSLSVVAMLMQSVSHGDKMLAWE